MIFIETTSGNQLAGVFIYHDAEKDEVAHKRVPVRAGWGGEAVNLRRNRRVF